MVVRINNTILREMDSLLIVSISACSFYRVVTSRALSWPWQPCSQAHEQKKTHIDSSSSTRIKISRKSQAFFNADQVKNGHGLEHLSIWLPNAPVVPRPRSIYNAAALAYLGDSIYELYVRCHFLSPPQSIDKYNSLVMSLVCCEAQDAFLQKLLEDDFLSEEERNVVRWGKNIQTNHKRATKRAGTAIYCNASALETLIGYLYLTDRDRLSSVMAKLGLNTE